MASRWEDMADQLNEIFLDDNARRQFSNQFKALHGNNGERYRFGVHASRKDVKGKNNNQLIKDDHRGQFMIDSGTSHWDGTLGMLEAKIKHHATNNLKLKFNVIMSDNPLQVLATAIYNDQLDPPEITITCPRDPGRTPKKHP